jgi:multidrug efflux pump subunit AcrB
MLDSPQGVDVELVGARDRQVIIGANQEKLESLGISLDEVVRAVASRNVTVPGGTLEGRSREYLIRTIGEIEEIGEFRLIEELAEIVSSGREVIKGIGDDAAVLSGLQRKEYLLLATDSIAENIHFVRNAGAGRIGRKALGVNLSDIAAMGGIPLWALINLGIPKRLPVEVYLLGQSRFRHLFANDAGREGIELIQSVADKNIEKYNLIVR